MLPSPVLGEERRFAGLGYLRFRFTRQRGRVCKIEDGSHRLAQSFNSLAEVGGPVLPGEFEGNPAMGSMPPRCPAG